MNGCGGWMAGFRCDSKRLSKPVWRILCGRRPPGGSIAAIICVTESDLKRCGVALILAPFMAVAGPDGSAPRMADARDHERHLLENACGLAARLLPKDFPPTSTVYGWFLRLSPHEGLFETDQPLDLVMADRERTGRQASPSAAVIDSQSVKTIESRRSQRL